MRFLPRLSRRELFCFLLACTLRLGLAAFFHPGHASGAPTVTGAFAVWGGDTFSYLDSIENLFQHGVYAQNINRLETYAGRMPGYGAVYALLRLVAGRGPAADGLIGLQLLLSLGSIYCLGRLAQAATGHVAAFQWAVLLYGASTFGATFDIRLLTESFATSAQVIGVYTLCRAHREARAGLWLGAGAWLAWAVFLRPFLAPWLGAVAVGYAGWAVAGPAASRGRRVAQAALLVLPFLLADGAWMVRNWRWYHRPVPLQGDEWAGYQTAPGLRQLTDFMGVIGEEPNWWEPASFIAWFYQPQQESEPSFQYRHGQLAPPAYTSDSLLLVKRNLALAQDSTRPRPTRQAAETAANRALERYSRAFRRLRPIRAYGLVPLRLAYRLTLAHPGDYLFRRPFPELALWQKAIKIMAHLWYLVVIGLGLLGTLCLGWRRQFGALLAKSVPVYLVVLLCFILFRVEFRYFAVAYPFVVIGTVNLVLAVQAFIRQKQRVA